MRLGTLVVALAAALVGAPAAHAAERGRLTVEPAATVAGGSVRLADVAALEGDARALADVDLGPAPAPGESRRLSGAVILRRLHEAGLDPAAVRYTIPSAVRVERASQEVTADEIRIAVENVAPAALLPEESLGAIEVASGVRIPLGPYEARVSTSPPAGRGGRRRFEVQLVQEGTTVAKVPVTAAIATVAPVVTVKHAVPRGSILRIEDVSVEERELGTGSARALRNPEDAIGKEARIALTPGTALTAEALASPLLVQRGDNVTVVVETPALRVSVAGEALESGAAGAAVRVRNRTSKQELAGKVVERGVVLVQY